MYFKETLLSTLTVIIGTLGYNPQAQALIPTANSEGNLEFSTSISDLGAIEKDGQFTADSFIVNILGYNPSRSWKAGDRPEDVLLVGDLTGYGLETLSLTEISQLQGTSFDAESVGLNQIGFLQDLNLEDLANSIPNFENLKVEEVPPLAAILGNEFNNFRIENILDRDANSLNQLNKERTFEEVSSIAKEQIIELAQKNASNILTNFNELNNNYTEYANNNLDGTGVNDFNEKNQEETSNLLVLNENIAREVENNVANYLTSNPELTDLEIEAYLKEQLDNYQSQIQDTLSTATNTLTNETLETIKNSFSSNQEIQESIDSFIEETVTEFNNNLKDSLQNNIETTNQEIESVIDEEIGKLSEDLDFVDTIGEIELSDFDLSEFSVADVPGLEDTDLENFENIANARISDIPNLSNLELDKFPNIPAFGTIAGRVDLIFSEVEKFADRAISGGKEPENCFREDSLNDGCAHVEYVGIPSIRGKQWVTGDSQEVEGGNGVLKSFGGGVEPTGRFPFPDPPFKLVLRNADETVENIELKMSFRFCIKTPFGRSCTPYNLFEVPFWDFGIRDFMYLGI